MTEPKAEAPVIRDLLEQLGLTDVGNDIDEAVRWALIEILIRRQGLTICNQTFGSNRLCMRDVGHGGDHCDTRPGHCTCT